MAVTSISRDTNNNVCLVRMMSSDTVATVISMNYIFDQMPIIMALNNGTWDWFFSDMILCACSDQNVLLVFSGDDFNTVSPYGASSSGIVMPGLTNQIAYYASNGSIISGLPTANNGVLITSGLGVPSISSTLPAAVQTNIAQVGTIGSGVWNGSVITVPFGGTGDSSFTPYTVICGGTTAAGALQNIASVGTLGQVLTSNGPGALPTMQNAPGTGTVNAGLANQMAYYAANGTAVSGLTSVASAVLTTTGLGVPLWVASTGTGSPVLATSPTLVTPTIKDGSANNIAVFTSNFNTYPRQPQFDASLVTSTGNVTADGAAYILSGLTTKAPVVGSAFNAATGVFTAPVSGMYLLSFGLSIVGTTTGSTDGRILIRTTVTTYSVFRGNLLNMVSSGSGNLSISGSAITYLGAGQTAYIEFTEFNHGSKNLSLAGGALGDSFTYYQGWLLG